MFNGLLKTGWRKIILDKDSVIKKQLLFLLRGGNAHIPIKRAVHNFPVELINEKLTNISYTPWQLLEHLRICQDDIIQFIKDPQYKSPEWPAGYWPDSEEIADEVKWKKSVDDFFEGLDEMEDFVKDDDVDLYEPLPHADQYTIFREVLVLADHNAYHIGQLMLFKKLIM
jgi:hypothetical protein